MKLASVVITEHTAITPKQCWQACKSVSREYPAIGYLHTNQTVGRGSNETPHIHLFIMLPEDRVQLWQAGAKADLARHFASNVVSLSNPDEWVLNPDKPVLLLRYAIGNERWHTPIPAYWKTNSPFTEEQRALDALLNQAFKSRAA